MAAVCPIRASRGTVGVMSSRSGFAVSRPRTARRAHRNPAQHAAAPVRRAASTRGAIEDYRGAVREYPLTFVVATTAVGALAAYWLGSMMGRRQALAEAPTPLEVPLPSAPSSLGPLPTPIPPATTQSPAQDSGMNTTAIVSTLVLMGLLAWGSGVFAKPAAAR